MSFEGLEGLEFVSLVDLGMAYRKAKVDAFYFQIANRLEFLEYEENLQENLERLYKSINHSTNESQILFDPGAWTLSPKLIKPINENHGFIFSDPQKQWEANSKNTSENRVTAVFRIMARPSIDFYVFSALWMDKVGHKFDECLDETAYGNRLRRKDNGRLNPYSLGSFKPYIKPFTEWRDNGLKVMRQSLEEGKSTIAITADVSSFYHELNPDFMMDKGFLSQIGLELEDTEWVLTHMFINLLKQWAENTPLKKGLPVGLPASAVVANMALIELDRLMQQQIVPLYYGRYVDDMLLVVENKSNFTSINEVWSWIFDRSNGLLNWVDKTKKEAIQFTTPYLKDCKIEFSNSKTKVFLLEGETGQSLINSLEYQIRERASEWRALPDLPANSENVSSDLVAAVQSDGVSADNLRKADALSIRKAGFAIKLRDFEAYERDLPPKAWQAHRKAFLDSFLKQVLVLPVFFDFSNYLPRVIRIATACEDFSELDKIITRLLDLTYEVDKHCIASIKSCDTENTLDHWEFVEQWRGELSRTINENIQAAFPPKLTVEGKKKCDKYFNSSGELNELNIEFDIKKIQLTQSRLFSHDMAHVPFRFIGLPKELTTQRGIPIRKTIEYLSGYEMLLDEPICDGLNIVSKLIKCNRRDEIPIGLLFATRPFNVTEINFLYRDPYTLKATQEMSKAVLAIRGFALIGKLPFFDPNKNILEIDSDKDTDQFRIAVASWKTEIDSWIASIVKQPDPDLKRYTRLNQLFNDVLRFGSGTNYLIMPEVSIPARWFLRMAYKLQGKGISLIAGVEYLHKRKKIVRNQVWASLSNNSLGFPSLTIYRQDKQRPALHEEQELFRLAGLTMKPEKTWRTPPVIRHGNFQFALLVCSELTNIKYRAALRGNVDALFIPEWNQDTESFNALVESAALDMHAYIVQCNDRQHGDSRIRAPYKDNWKRDIVRIKGGKNDYFVVGEIDINALRQFQSSHRSPGKPFKPVPDGFEIDFHRKTLPSA
jgi:hypothetical protein